MKKKTINIEFTEQNNPENYENCIHFKWLDVQEEDEEDIAKANLIHSLQKHANEQVYPKLVNGGLFNY